MTSENRWFRSEEQELRLLQVQSTTIASSPLRQKRSVHDLDTSSSDDNLETMDENNEVELTPKEVMAFLRRIDRNVENLATNMAEIRGEIHELKVEKDNLKQAVDELRSENEFLHSKIGELETKIDIALKQSHHNSQYSRRNNLRFFGVKENAGENVFATIVDLVKNKLNVTDFSMMEIDAAHRLGVQDSKQQNPKPRAIIVRFVRRTMRDKIIKNRKLLAKTRMSITEDLTKQNAQLMYAAKNHDAVESVWSSEGRIMICVKGSKKITAIKSIGHLNSNAQAWLSWVNPKPAESRRSDHDATPENGNQQTNGTGETPMQVQSVETATSK